MPRIELVVTDLDGTLWDEREQLHPKTVAALARLDRRGVPWLVATGRRTTSTRRPLRAAGLTPPAVVLNGGVGLDLATGEVWHRHAFDPVAAADVLSVFVAAGLEPCVYVDHDEHEVVVGPGPSTHPAHLASFGERVACVDLAAIVAEVPVLAFGILGLPGARFQGVADAIARVATPHVSPDRIYGGVACTVAPLDRSKWDGVAAYCGRAGLDPGAVLAIGDGPNDVELLERAAVAVVPSDADASARSHADHVVGAAAHGGWADVLDLLDLGDRRG